jgi:hypothetical protein
MGIRMGKAGAYRPNPALKAPILYQLSHSDATGILMHCVIVYQFLPAGATDFLPHCVKKV